VATQSPRPGDEATKGSTVRLFVSDGPGSSTVPPVTGMSQAKAEKALRAAGFKVTTTRAYSADVAAGKVVSSSPPEGTSADKGSTVRLTISRGQQPVAVPSVVGKDVAEARGLLEGKGFKVTTTDKPVTGQSTGTVLSQSPSGGARAKPGSTVALTVAKEQVKVPDVTNQPALQARATLRSAGLKPKSVPTPVSDKSQNKVVQSQSPGKDTQVDRGTVVTLQVGQYTAPAPTATPSPTPTPTATATP
jgi:serine/threonine-protein kinase